MESGMNKKIGFAGLGQMGRWMALNLIKNGFPVIVYDISEAAMDVLAAEGARKADSPACLAGESDWIFFSLPDSDSVEQVVYGPEGIAREARDGQRIIDLGTSNYLWTKAFAERLKNDGMIFSDAPVTGMEDRAKEATLTIMFGGEKEVLAEVSPALEALGNKIVYMGGIGNGQLAKMINNVLLNVHLAALAEILPMAVKLGLDPRETSRVINSGSGQSFASRLFLPEILNNSFNHGYPMDHAYKDMVNAVEISAREKIPIPVVHSALSTYQTAMRSGYGKEDKGAMIKHFEKLLNVKIR